MTVQKGPHPASGASLHSARQKEAKSSLEMERQSSLLLSHPHQYRISVHPLRITHPPWLDGADGEDAVGAHGARS